MTPATPAVRREADVEPVVRSGRWGPDSVVRRDSVYRRSLVVADLGAVATTLALAMALNGNHWDVAKAALMTALLPLVVLMGKVIGLYDKQVPLVRKSTLEEAPLLFQLATLYALIFWLTNGLLVTGVTDRRRLLTLWLALFPLLLLYRVAARRFSRLATSPERCLVIGGGPTCERIRARFASSHSAHAVVAAYVPFDDLGNDQLDLNALSHSGDLEALISDYEVDRIIVAPERADADDVLNLIRAATALGVKVSVVPRILEVVGSAVEFDDVEGVPLLSMRRLRLSSSSRFIKRALDVAVSLAALTLLAPLWLIIAIAIKLDSRGPVLFRQDRVGRNGKPFEMLKFRTMFDGAHAQREQLRHLNEADGLFKIEHDPRITRVGGLLRRLSFDEIPQLWNVVRGDMSLVGPRPLIAEEDQRVLGWHRRRLQLTPGMTGHWQILGSARIPLDEMVKIDYLYVTNWSLWNDIKILLRTIPYVVGQRGM